ncbi:MAG TPA: hypothetical protein VFF30_14645 [Nitrososphaerales archaeon]|nr:hypothetical protein [Nitrososphaerales archaeon]
MVDTTTLLVVISTVVQTIVLGVTLIVFVFQFRSQERVIKESSYQGLMGRYNDLVSTLVDRPELALSLFSVTGLADEMAKKVSKEDIAV